MYNVQSSYVNLLVVPGRGVSVYGERVAISVTVAGVTVPHGWGEACRPLAGRL